MAHVAVLHSVLGPRAAVPDAAARLEEANHEVQVVDLYEGRSFDSYTEARAFAERLGNAELDRRAIEATATLPSNAFVLGFSLSAVLAEQVAARRPLAGVVLFSGALSMQALGLPGWPAGLPLQLHFTHDDPLRSQAQLDALVAEARAANAPVRAFGHLGAGHLFTDPGRREEYDADSAHLAWLHVLAFLADPTTPR